MNDKQKIFVMVGVGSSILFILSITLLQFSLIEPFKFWDTGYKNGEGFAHWKTNWLGIASIFNVVVSATGFFLFKDK